MCLFDVQVAESSAPTLRLLETDLFDGGTQRHRDGGMSQPDLPVTKSKADLPKQVKGTFTEEAYFKAS